MSLQLRRCGVVLLFFFCTVGLSGAVAEVPTPPGSVTPVDLPPVWPGDGAPASTAPQLYGVGGGGLVELGQRVTLTAIFYTEGADYTYVWRKGETVIAGASASKYVIEAAVAADAGTYSVTVSNSAGTSVASAEVTVKTAAPPVLIAPPYALVRYVGQEAQFSYAATGSYPRFHQWRKNGVDIPGATEAGHTIAAVTAADAGTYSVVVTNSLGSVTTTGASLTVNAALAPVIYSGYPFDRSVTAGNSTSFEVHFSSGSSPYTYQWFKNGVLIAGATSNSYSLPIVQLTDAGKYSVKVTNAAGAATSREATLSVTPAIPPSFSSPPQGQSIFEGQSVSFSVGMEGSWPMRYQWLKDGSPITGATGSYFSIQTAKRSDAGSYTVVATNHAGSATSAAATLVVNPAVLPKIAVQPASRTLAYGDYLSLSVEITGSSPFTYQWEKDGVALPNGSNWSYSISNVTPANSGSYTVVVTNAAGSVTSNAATITVQPAVAPSITRQPEGKTVAYGTSFSLSVAATGSPNLRYEWRKDGLPLGANGSDYYVSTATPTHSGVYTVVIANPGGSVTSQGATITVQPAIVPTIIRQPVGQTVAYGAYVTLSVETAGSSPLSYQWKKDGVVLGNSYSSGNHSSYSLSDATPAHSGVYTVVITNPAGSVTSQNATLTVRPAIAPTITRQPVGQTAAYGSYITLSVEATGSSPLSYQWKKDGVAVGNSYSNYSSYSISDTTPLHSGVYTVVITNVAGTVTSQSATVTIQPAVAPTISVQPVARTVPYGESFELSVQAAGSPQLRYEWKKDGVGLSSNSSRYYVSRATTEHSGVYSVTITNSAGSVTSQSVTVTVPPAIAPTITTQPQSQSVPFNGSVRLSVGASGSSPLSYQWSKDGVKLGSDSTSSSLNFWTATPAESGVYSVVVSNVAGSVTSAKATVTVNAAVPATITRQPESVEVAVGLSASFSVQVDSRGAGSLTYQWRRNGQAIANANSSYYTISSVTESDAGDYTLVITGPGGTVTSAVATLTVLPMEPPRISSSSNTDVGVNLGSRFSLSPGSITGSPPLTYQWSKDGVAIPDATSAYYYSPSSPTVNDLGAYLLTVSNAAGLATSVPIEVRLSSPGSVAAPWVDAARMGDIVYFLATVPGRMERFDLAAERWLPTVLLSDTEVPTALAPTSEGIYVAYGRSLVRWSPDLKTQTSVGNAWRPISLLYVYGDFIYHTGTGSNGPDYGSFSRTTLKPGPSSQPGFIGLPMTTVRQVSFATSLGKGFYWSAASWSPELYTFSVGADGAFRSFVTSSLNGAWAPASRTFVIPGDQRVADDGGSVFSTADLKFVGSFAQGFADLAFLSDNTPVVLRGDKLSLAGPANYVESSRVALPQPGFRMFTRGATVFVFGAPTVAGGTYSVTKVAKSAFVPERATATVEPPFSRYSIEDAFLGEDEVLHVLSRSLGGLVRWSAKTRTLLPTIQLRSVPTLAFHQPGSARALLVYPDHAIADLPLRATAAGERALGALNLRMNSIVDLGDRVMLDALTNSGNNLRVLLGSDGFIAPPTGGANYGKGLAWQSAGRRLYSLSGYSSSEMRYDIVPEVGDLPAPTTGNTAGLVAPLRFNPEGTLAATGNGRVVNADLQQVGALANDIADAAWLPDGLYTLRSRRGRAEIQQWTRSTYVLKNSLQLDGVPVRIFRLSETQMTVVTMLQGMAAFTVINADLSISTSPVSPIQVSAQPRSQAAVPEGSASFSVSQQGGAASVSYQWLRNGTTLSGAVSSSYTVAEVAPASAGLYSARISDAANITFTEPAILGVSTTQKVIGTGTEFAGDVVHPNGRSYDQILPSGAAVSVTADLDQVVRTSFIDMNDDIVQVEFSGAGTLSIVLTGAAAPAAPVNYNQSNVRYVKGHAGIVISGADETTNVSVFSIGRATAFDPTGAFNILQPIGAANDPAHNGSALFAGHEATAYDGLADIAYIAILSDNGKFGGIRAANTNFFASTGVTGIYAPGVQFTGPVYFGSIDAFGDATPTLVLGSAGDVRVTGGDLQQTNSRAIKVAGVSQVKFVGGTTSHGVALPAQQNRARFDQNGVDVTAQIVVNPVVE